MVGQRCVDTVETYGDFASNLTAVVTESRQTARSVKITSAGLRRVDAVSRVAPERDDVRRMSFLQVFYFQTNLKALPFEYLSFYTFTLSRIGSLTPLDHEPLFIQQQVRQTLLDET